MRFVGWCGLLIVSCNLVGCDTRDDLSSGAAIVRDSAGIEIVETTSQRYPSEWRLETKSDWAVGEIEGDPAYLLSRVAGAMQLPDGRVVVADGGTNEVRFYGSRGEHLQTVGRSGEGPGEYQYLRALAAVGRMVL